ncbi:hypothetical protein BTUL_0558g00010 [Botrytis tulipae]|uniref:Uncharacterized protein n=1 Tax=Botrytis tulipae TaxID=87230 RepID=A0A4Z1E6I7_9HELO|nr:hypothetical protein BTUL_0558g00010 [Botrytis tulipae]
MDLDQNNSCPQLLVAQSKQEITQKSSPLKSQSVVSEKKKSHKAIDLINETSNESKSKEELEAESAGIDLSIRSCVATFRIGKYSDRAINDDALFLTLLNSKWERLRLIDQVKVFLFKAMKAKTESVIGDVDAEIPSFQDSDLPLEHIIRLIAISKISTCAKKDKIGAEISQLDSFGRGILFLYPFILPELQKGGENKTAFKKWSVARLSVLCTLIHSSQSAFAKNLRISAKAFEPFLQELSNDLDFEALFNELDSQDFHPVCLEDPRYQHDSDKLQELFEEFPDTLVDAVMELYREKKPKDLYLLRSSNLEIFNNKPKEAQKGLRRIVPCVKAFGSHWTTQLAQITTSAQPEATILINIKVWDSFDTGHTPTLDFQRWLTEVFMLEEDPKTVKCSVQRMNSMQKLNFDACRVIALNNAIAI